MLIPTEKFKVLLNDFNDVCRKYSEFGAADDGDHIIARCIRKALNGELKVPKTADGWDLFTYNMKCGTASRALTSSANKVCKHVLKHRDSIAFNTFVNQWVG